MAEGALHVGVAQHPRQLPGPRLPRHRPHVARRHTAARPLGHDQLVAGVRGDLGKVRDDEGLAVLVARDGRECLTHAPAHLPADPLVHLVEHERRHGVVLRQHHLQSQHETRQLATRGDLGEGTGLETDVQLHLKDDVLAPVCAVRGARLQRRTKPAPRHAQRREQLIDSRGQPPCARFPFGTERGAGAREVGRGVVPAATVYRLVLRTSRKLF